MASTSLTRLAAFGRNAPRSSADSTWKTRATIFAVACTGVAAYVALGLQLAPPRAADPWSTTTTAEFPATQYHFPHE
jgi:hypothetical protein